MLKCTNIQNYSFHFNNFIHFKIILSKCSHINLKLNSIFRLHWLGHCLPNLQVAATSSVTLVLKRIIIAMIHIATIIMNSHLASAAQQSHWTSAWTARIMWPDQPSKNIVCFGRGFTGSCGKRNIFCICI